MIPPEPPSQGTERQGWLERRREKVRAEVERNRRGEYTVPTWVLALALVLIVGAWLALVILA
ncbi:hypothetical protein [Micromonospora phaseoli]|uniref:hypothetical protein n=1 Tax=Micromonospora phaseoli TaxID=1144548 RepID=UPI000B857BBD|nr:hypothetical protein [Micromonospora phaseoli]